ncbi:MAG: heavy metal translocating P-type ATPase [Defluviitaleaceae bacterium]|nr:heavy metal translocating P-type ATPase [Defluviitaleaceae bacterium]
MKYQLRLTGMTCAACAARAEKSVGKLAGVLSCAVNFAAERISVEYDPKVTDLDAIKKRIEKNGFGWSEIKIEADKKGGPKKKDEINLLRGRLFLAAAFAAPLLYVAMGHMLPFGFALPLPKIISHQSSPLNFTLVQLFLTVPILFAGRHFYFNGLRAVILRSPNMDSLIAMGTSAAFGYGLYAAAQIMRGFNEYADHLYFETAGVIVTLILLGKTIEAVSKGRTGEAIKKLMELAPATAVVVRGGVEKEIPVGDVKIGDILIIKPGSKIPADGVVTEGAATADESMLTGESMPVDKKAGDRVFAATLSINGFIKFRAEKVGEDTALAQIIKFVGDALDKKAPIAKLADRVSGVFVPVVFCIAAAAFVGWFIATRDVRFSLTIFISVLVIACPCALGLATPTAVMVGAGKGAAGGILIKSGSAFETAHKINFVVFDKTGTITEGRPEVTDVASFYADESRLLQLAASAEKSSEHPLGEAVVKHAAKKNLPLLPAADFVSETGRGIFCRIDGCEVLIGNAALMNGRGIQTGGADGEVEKFSRRGKTPVYVAINNILAGIIAVADVVKQDSAAAVKQLNGMGIKTAMITGDNARTAEAVAMQAGIKRVYSEVLPQDKAREISRLQAEGNIVAMVGDGINDAPALAQADVGMAIGGGTDIAIESADIVLMQGSPAAVPAAVKLSKITIRNIKQNLFWAFGYNTLGIPVAAGLLHIFGGPLLSPVIAAAAMSLSSVSVLANALRLKHVKLRIR